MSQHSQYPLLFEPLQLSGVTIRNRTLMGSMHTGLEEEKNGFERMARYYAERAAGEAGLIVTGGIAPNRAGWVAPFGAKMSTGKEAKKHKVITDAVHAEGGHICMQILHTGRYAYHPFAVAPSKLRSPITPFTPKALSEKGIESTIQDFVNCAAYAIEAGYDGVEIMGSEGYLINQFIAAKTNQRTDHWGGSYENRTRFPLEIIRRTRERIGRGPIIIYRLSMLDLVEEGSTWEEVLQLALAVEKAGASVINTGIGWHEARIPTIATMVPRAEFTWVTKRLMGKVGIPLITTNRINNAATAEKVLADSCADMVSMARPFLADPELVKKSREGKENTVNTCIACNQSCLDHVFDRKVASCLVNPRACFETVYKEEEAKNKKKVAVVGAGPSGLTCAITLAQRGHEVSLYEKHPEIGGQFLYASRIPGKEEFRETLRYYRTMLDQWPITVHLNSEFKMNQAKDFDEVVISTGVRPRIPSIPGMDHENVVDYAQVLEGKVKIGQRVAIIGAGGIGFDMASFLGHPSMDKEEFEAFWGVTRDESVRGGLESHTLEIKNPRVLTMLKRSPGKAGKDLGKTTGWIHRETLRKLGVVQMSSVEYIKIDDKGLYIRHQGEEKCLEVAHIVICAGQESVNELAESLQSMGSKVHLIGGALKAGEIDAARAIREGYELALKL
ncbi:MAG: NADPH-dependent 2,4-dienoyl-CoA reductase [Bacteroidetes bacterium]|nr:NADPH-dependent 2,4-dienoyl-CoA reductase [Bacteroidota bacterium]